ncbi:MAG: type II toxin-antitoxin system VapC family toxin [Deltaproteobacteria bacterium]|nr:type II toxin-antitoxin system VapC family toxin [Deltaproteobacteria bacterium]
MQFWDASALVSLVVAEDDSERLRRLARQGDLVTWCLSTVEICSAIERRSREGVMRAADRQNALGTLKELSESWTEITAMAVVRDRACRLLAVHSLRSADALQLAAALIAAGDRPTDHYFICADGRLREAASREGFKLDA